MDSATQIFQEVIILYKYACLTTVCMQIRIIGFAEFRISSDGLKTPELLLAKRLNRGATDHCSGLFICKVTWQRYIGAAEIIEKFAKQVTINICHVNILRYSAIENHVEQTIIYSVITSNFDQMRRRNGKWKCRSLPSRRRAHSASTKA